MISLREHEQNERARLFAIVYPIVHDAVSEVVWEALVQSAVHHMQTSDMRHVYANSNHANLSIPTCEPI
jgi:hypothetical protein